ncbi:hypothetical protein BDV95DRAFT_259354 [Massariosphaeria phaeospora]|uniref:DUF8021 domain-containing protein n=1 Tax=Massariosphaeria phaeospora TaxID=100035 RepID=A0A7C8M218_9PLEO|nr:hypothetical protein BDV95DRAFT_259354 [Massariosphaeria phaeospora]
MFVPVLFVCAGVVAQASAACDRTMLQKATVAYVQAQAAGQPDLLPLAKNVSYLENDAPMDIKKGVLSQPVTIDFDRSLHDTTTCTAFTELSAATNKHPYVINTRLLFTGDTITAIESVVADDGDWVFNATSQLAWTKTEKWDPIPEAKWDSRATIKAAGDAYLDSWTNGSIKAPYGTPCARLEGGIYTGERNSSSNSCFMPVFPEPFTIRNRRYVIDESLGGLAIFNDFPFIDLKKPNGTASTNFFRVEGGLIRYIHEVTVCSTRGCGR